MWVVAIGNTLMQSVTLLLTLFGLLTNVAHNIVAQNTPYSLTTAKFMSSFHPCRVDKSHTSFGRELRQCMLYTNRQANCAFLYIVTLSAWRQTSCINHYLCLYFFCYCPGNVASLLSAAVWLLYFTNEKCELFVRRYQRQICWASAAAHCTK